MREALEESDDYSESEVPPQPETVSEPLRLLVPADALGERLDRVLAHLLPDYSRNRLQAWIEEGRIAVDGVARPGKHRLSGGERLEVRPASIIPALADAAEDLPLQVVHADADLLVIDKPAGLVVHPGSGVSHGTLLNALLHHFPETAGVPRAGIVHRLDRDTSGVIVVARTEEAHHALARQFERRTTAKTYLAITQGAPRLDRDEIDLPIGIHPYQREKMAVRRDHATSRQAVSRYEVLERFGVAALVRVTPQTGRTHQIRVHLAAIGCPVLCDGLYSGRTVIDPAFLRLPPGPPLLARQALHAASLAIDHPASGERLTLAAPLPADMSGLLERLRSAT